MFRLVLIRCTAACGMWWWGKTSLQTSQQRWGKLIRCTHNFGFCPRKNVLCPWFMDLFPSLSGNVEHSFWGKQFTRKLERSQTRRRKENRIKDQNIRKYCINYIYVKVKINIKFIVHCNAAINITNIVLSLTLNVCSMFPPRCDNWRHLYPI